MSQVVDNLNAAIANLGGVIGQAVAALRYQAQIEQSVAKLNALAESLKNVLPSVSAPAADTSADSNAATAAEVPAQG